MDISMSSPWLKSYQCWTRRTKRHSNKKKERSDSLLLISSTNTSPWTRSCRYSQTSAVWMSWMLWSCWWLVPTIARSDSTKWGRMGFIWLRNSTVITKESKEFPFQSITKLSFPAASISISWSGMPISSIQSPDWKVIRHHWWEWNAPRSIRSSSRWIPSPSWRSGAVKIINSYKT